MRDEEAAFVNDECGGGVSLADKFTQRIIESLHVLLNQLGQGGHVMRAGGRFG